MEIIDKELSERGMLKEAGSRLLQLAQLVGTVVFVGVSWRGGIKSNKNQQPKPTPTQQSD